VPAKKLENACQQQHKEVDAVGAHIPVQKQHAELLTPKLKHGHGKLPDAKDSASSLPSV
jgi:hypothetical protein